MRPAPKLTPERCVRIASALLLTLAACRGASPEAEISRPASSVPLAVSLALAVPPGSAPAPASATMVESATEASRALEEATLERLVFRQIMVGSLVYPPRRRTWVLHRGVGRARLDLFCQVGVHTPTIGMSLTGKENEESIWGPPIVTRYAGTREGEDLRSCRVTFASGAAGKTPCEKMPGTLLLSCRPESIGVLQAGAALIVGQRGPPDEIPPWRWQPPALERVASLRCDLSNESDPDRERLLYPWPLVFVAPRQSAPGVEWAHENGDMVVQQGAYRWMPSAK